MQRREFLKVSSAGLAAAVGVNAGGLGKCLAEAEGEEQAKLGKAENCIFIWLGGGACHIDTWDPKRQSTGRKDPGSYYRPIDTAIDGVQLCEHLKRLAPLMDRCIPVRSVNHDVIDEHAAATNRLHTGRPPTGTTLYPSIGSVFSSQLGAIGEGVPPYVVMGYPSASRGPGFLGAEHGYVYLTDTEAGPAGLRRPPFITADRQARRQQLLSALRKRFGKRAQSDAVRDYIATSEQAAKLAGPEFMKVFQLATESASLRNQYGEEFGQRCLLARRLVEAGVRFVEVSFNLNFINGTGWDTHNDGQLKQHVLIEQLDQALTALLTDLEKRNRLDRTLVVVATEFGRPPEFDGGGGRGHYSKAFSVLLAGGGLATGQAIGVTDELGKEILQRPVSVPDLHATLYATLGVNPAELLYDGERPVPITDRGAQIHEIFG
ncbi:MAG: DUF1501 domain-containing protein [Pirellulaceae bacterium]|jgi:hypothetical protein|nr:DUF1501 domain-containing protein [Pirellulaceae bacterium]MDP7019957.1 DUF1501 domain-containing protein [Pirellulaceae bacterium]